MKRDSFEKVQQVYIVIYTKSQKKRFSTAGKNRGMDHEVVGRAAIWEGAVGREGEGGGSAGCAPVRDDGVATGSFVASGLERDLGKEKT